MGVDYCGAIAVGVPVKDLPFDEAKIHDLELDTQLCVIPPYYDAGIQECLLGIYVECAPDYGWSTLDHEKLADDIKEAKVNFLKIIGGVEPKVYLMSVGT